MKTSSKRFGVLALAISIILAPKADGQTYTVTDLGTLGGSESAAFGINDSGEIVGDSYTSGNAAQHAFSYGGGTMTDLGTLGGSQSAAIGINNSGQIVGDSLTSGNAAQHAFSYSGGAMTDLGTLGGKWTSSSAFAVNNSGQIVGESSTSPGGGGHSRLLLQRRNDDRSAHAGRGDQRGARH